MFYSRITRRPYGLLLLPQAGRRLKIDLVLSRVLRRERGQLFGSLPLSEINGVFATTFLLPTVLATPRLSRALAVSALKVRAPKPTVPRSRAPLEPTVPVRKSRPPLPTVHTCMSRVRVATVLSLPSRVLLTPTVRILRRCALQSTGLPTIRASVLTTVAIIPPFLALRA